MATADEKKPPVGGVVGVRAGTPHWHSIVITHHALPQPPTLGQRVGAAFWLVSHGFDAEHISVATAAMLMHPQRRYTRLGLVKAANQLLTDSVSVALRAAPPQAIEQIETALAQCQQKWAPRPE